jgi:hypothetical protein
MLEGAFAANSPADTADARNGQPARSVAVDGLGTAVSAGTLRRYSGGGLVQNNQTITGTVTGNTATQVTTGANTINGNAFSGASGLPMVVQNTGNNVLIQSGVIVNVQLKP